MDGGGGRRSSLRVKSEFSLISTVMIFKRSREATAPEHRSRMTRICENRGRKKLSNSSVRNLLNDCVSQLLTLRVVFVSVRVQRNRANEVDCAEARCEEPVPQSSLIWHPPAYSVKVSVWQHLDRYVFLIVLDPSRDRSDEGFTTNTSCCPQGTNWVAQVQ